MMEIKVKEIKIDLGDKKLILSIEEAKQLKRALDDIIEKEIAYIPYWRYIPYPIPYTQAPFTWPSYTVWCGDSSVCV